MTDKAARIIRYYFVVSPANAVTGIYVHEVGSRIAPPYTSYQVHDEGAPCQ